MGIFGLDEPCNVRTVRDKVAGDDCGILCCRRSTAWLRAFDGATIASERFGVQPAGWDAYAHLCGGALETRQFGRSGWPRLR